MALQARVGAVETTSDPKQETTPPPDPDGGPPAAKEPGEDTTDAEDLARLLIEKL